MTDRDDKPWPPEEDCDRCPGRVTGPHKLSCVRGGAKQPRFNAKLRQLGALGVPIHFARVPFVAACGADETNQATTTILERVTCDACRVEVLRTELRNCLEKARPKATIKVWLDESEGGEEPEEPNVAGEWMLLENVALRFAEDRYGSADYPEEQAICVREADGTLHRFVVTAEPSTVFRARALP